VLIFVNVAGHEHGAENMPDEESEQLRPSTPAEAVEGYRHFFMRAGLELPDWFADMEREAADEPETDFLRELRRINRELAAEMAKMAKMAN
jgi:hypothetical protein